MIRDGSLTSADITWTSTNVPSQCLVTWEVSGGGLMGNLLTDTPDAQLSLWPDTKYRVQVTCKNKVRTVFCTITICPLNWYTILPLHWNPIHNITLEYGIDPWPANIHCYKLLTNTTTNTWLRFAWYKIALLNPTWLLKLNWVIKCNYVFEYDFVWPHSSVNIWKINS